MGDAGFCFVARDMTVADTCTCTEACCPRGVASKRAVQDVHRRARRDATIRVRDRRGSLALAPKTSHTKNVRTSSLDQTRSLVDSLVLLETEGGIPTMESRNSLIV